jgi:hypothetical protein
MSLPQPRPIVRDSDRLGLLPLDCPSGISIRRRNVRPGPPHVSHHLTNDNVLYQDRLIVFCFAGTNRRSLSTDRTRALRRPSDAAIVRDRSPPSGARRWQMASARFGSGRSLSPSTPSLSIDHGTGSLFRTARGPQRQRLIRQNHEPAGRLADDPPARHGEPAWRRRSAAIHSAPPGSPDHRPSRERGRARARGGNGGGRKPTHDPSSTNRTKERPPPDGSRADTALNSER